MQLILLSLTSCIDAGVTWPLPLPSLENLDWYRIAHRQIAHLPFFASFSLDMVGRAPHSMELEPWPSSGIQCSVFVAFLQGPSQGGSEIRNDLCHVVLSILLSPNLSWLTLFFFPVCEYFTSLPSCLYVFGRSGHASSSLCGKGMK